MKNTPARTRTLDPLIKSQLLYQLSYRCIGFLNIAMTGRQVNPVLTKSLGRLAPLRILAELDAGEKAAYDE
jgi:hypothetical protein